MSDTDARARSQHLVEQLNTLWRVGESEPTAPPSLPKRFLNLIRTRLLRRQETFNSATVQYINESVRPLELAIDQYKTARDDVRRFQEALAARERRMEALIDAIRTEHAEIRTSIGVLQQATHNLGNVVSGFSRTDHASVASPSAPASTASVPSSSVETLSHKYVGFEDAFRGSSEEIERRQRSAGSRAAGARSP